MSWSKVIEYLEKSKAEAENQYAASAYTRVINQIKKAELKGKVTKASLEEIKLTDHMKEKIIEFTKSKPEPKTKTKHKSKPFKPDDGDKKLLDQLSSITGIGPTKAKELIKLGVTSVDDLEKDEYFNSLSIIGKAFVKYKPIDRIPRQTIFEIERMLMRDDVIFVGSYRRGSESSGDIDVMVGDLHQFHRLLVRVFDIPNVVLYSHGDDKSNFLIRYNGAWLQLDAFKYNENNKYAMLLYTTGSKQNNIRLRAAAKKKKALLNQEGLYDQDGRQIQLHSEEDIYNYLGLPYQIPSDR